MYTQLLSVLLDLSHGIFSTPSPRPHFSLLPVCNMPYKRHRIEAIIETYMQIPSEHEHIGSSLTVGQRYQ